MRWVAHKYVSHSMSCRELIDSIGGHNMRDINGKPIPPWISLVRQYDMKLWWEAQREQVGDRGQCNPDYEEYCNEMNADENGG